MVEDRAWAASPTVVSLLGVGTALPPHRLVQREVAPRLARLFAWRADASASLTGLLANAGVATRYSVCPPDWFEARRDWPERTQRYLEGATALFCEAADAALARAGIDARDIDTVVTVSSTGIATPTLEARAAARLGLRADVQRVPVFGLGCAGGVTGLAIARRLAAAVPGSRVLLVCVETCTLNFRADRPDKADLVAAALFGDGAAAVCLTSARAGGIGAPIVGDGVEHRWPDTLDVMGWEVDVAGLGVVFDRSIPSFVTRHFRAAVENGLERMRLRPADVDRFVCHPGGPKVVAAIEDTLELGAGTLDHERAVLAEVGNLSAPTVLFVLQRVLAAAPRGPLVLTALGPGFTAAMLPVRFDG